MVDIGATTHAAKAARIQAGVGQSHIHGTVVVRTADEAGFFAYDQFCNDAVHAPAQHPIWVRAWRDAVNNDAFIAFIERDGRAVAAIVLEVVKQGPFRVARFMGGKHANGNFIAAREGTAPLTLPEKTDLIAAIRQARPDVDILVLERQNPTQDGLANPLTSLKTMQSPNISLAVDLEDGFAATLSRSGGKRKRKKYRLQLRKFEEAGGHRLVEGTTAEEVERLISEFFVMKAARFRKKGIRDVFAASEVRDFFQMLYLRALELDEPPFVLHGVEVGGEFRAVNGVSMQRHSVVCEFGGIRDDDSSASPGYFLDYTNIEQACGLGKKLYDFSVGEEDYKRSWCDVETWQFDVLLPLTAKGRVAHMMTSVRARAVGYVKSNERLWSYIKGLRRKKADAPIATDD